MKYVADSSAVLAFVKGEKARADLIECLDESGISIVNLIEVAEFYADTGQPRSAAEAVISKLGLATLPIDTKLAIDAAQLKPVTRSIGASLADRCCLALAKRLKLPALTGDRKWAEIAEALDVEVILIR